MRESLLYFIWEYQLFNQEYLQTTNNQRLSVVKTGNRNTFSGPDFEEAVVKIDDIILHGKVEIHVESSDWKRHNHDNDTSYDQVILHIVWHNNMKIQRTDKTEIPILELKNIVSSRVVEQASWFKLREKPACSFNISRVGKPIIIAMYEKAIIDRLDREATEIEDLFKSGLPGEELLYMLIVRNFGFKYNKNGFSLLGEALPYRLIRKHLDKPFQVFALVLGQAGFLDNNLENEFECELHNEYLYLAHKYDLLPLKINKGVFKTGGIRPPNHPKVRLKQLANLLMHFTNLYGTLTKPLIKEHYYDLFCSNSIYEYTLPTSYSDIGLSKNSINNLMINTVIPFRYYFEKKYKKENIAEILSLLLSIPKERNRITDRMEKAGFLHKSALDSQSLLEIWEHYCKGSRCLNCKIGISIFKSVGAG